MKHIVIALTLLSVTVGHAQEPRSGVLSPFERALAERLDGTTEWQMDNGEMLTLTDQDGVTKLAAPRGTILEVPRPEHLEQVVSSRSVTCLLLRIMLARRTGGSDYSRLVRVARDADGRWVTHTLFARDAPPMNQLHRWVSEVGAVSDSGRKALLKIGEADQQATPYRMGYRWQTWLLDAPQKAAEGIRVPDGFDE
jgi:hypothetical protein